MTDAKPMQPCDDDDCPGWAIFDSGTDRIAIQRCDTCKRFDSDDEARMHALEIIEKQMQSHDELIAAAQDVVENWESGDLAGAVTVLGLTVNEWTEREGGRA